MAGINESMHVGAGGKLLDHARMHIVIANEAWHMREVESWPDRESNRGRKREGEREREREQESKRERERERERERARHTHIKNNRQ